MTCLPFVLIQKGLSTASTGLALGVFFAGGAAGKFLCGRIAQRIGIIPTVYLTEAVTGLGILLLLVLPLELTFVFLPLLQNNSTQAITNVP